MTIDELRQEIEQRTGVPASLLTGETVEENIAQAKTLLELKREGAAQRSGNTKDQFAKWLGDQIDEKTRQAADTFGIRTAPTDPEGAALFEIERKAKREAGYIPDGGEVDYARFPDTRPNREKFKDWLEGTESL